MARMLAVPGGVRHGFSYNCSFSHDFGRVTSIAATTKGNILLCDYDKNSLILVNPSGNYINKLKVDSEPYDLAITNQNIGYITQPNSKSVLQIDPDRMVVLHKATYGDLRTTILCVSAIPKTARDLLLYDEEDRLINTCLLGLGESGMSYAYPIKANDLDLTHISSAAHRYLIGYHVMKFHAVDADNCISCVGGQNYLKFSNQDPIFKDVRHLPVVKINTIDTPTDICSDDYGHIYVSCQGSNNVHRLTQELKVLDIPLDTWQGIKQPVALSFNCRYTKLYIVNELGKSVLVFDVI